MDEYRMKPLFERPKMPDAVTQPQAQRPEAAQLQRIEDKLDQLLAILTKTR